MNNPVTNTMTGPVSSQTTNQTANRKKAIQCAYTPLEKITVSDIKEMHSLFIKYYHNADLETFQKDINQKDGVFLVRQKSDNAIMGFSTVMKIKMNHNGKKIAGLFSGDTILDKKYWGSTAFNKPFFSYVLREKLKNPFTPFYWFLISKGYKTYLLLANNYQYYYPRFDDKNDKKSKRMKAVIDTYCTELFPGYYDEEKGLLMFGNEYQKLKSNVAEITESLKAKYPKIAFFDEKNSTWREGTELPCVGEINVMGIFLHVQKVLTRVWGKISASFSGSLEKKKDIAYQNSDAN
ncbi:MAG: hypothetical protein GY754_22915 [bacterium]|nr:hypothetical protein [bacterium]